MKTLVFAACAALLAAPVHAAEPKKASYYGAIAYHRDSQSWGTSHQARSARDAKIDALERCAHARCVIVVSVHNGCGALADGPKRYAAAPGVTRNEAESKALRKCGDAACRIAAWACTP